MLLLIGCVHKPTQLFSYTQQESLSFLLLSLCSHSYSVVTGSFATLPPPAAPSPRLQDARQVLGENRELKRALEESTAAAEGLAGQLETERAAAAEALSAKEMVEHLTAELAAAQVKCCPLRSCFSSSEAGFSEMVGLCC